MGVSGFEDAGDERGSDVRAARLEFLKGPRAMLDEQIAGMSETPKPGTKFTVE
jgi:hypothetical protein